MNFARTFALVIAAGLALAAPASAQWQTPIHSVPVGQGGGNIGFNSAAPGTAGQPLVSNGASVDPSFQAVPSAGIAASAIDNTKLANAPANTVKCNPTGGSAALQDCTAAQVSASLSLAQAAFVNTFTANHTIAQADCGGMVQMGTGATGQLTVTLPSVSGLVGVCQVDVYNGDAYSPGAARGKIMSGFPAECFYILFPHQVCTVKISNGAWVVVQQPGRWAQAGPQLYAKNGGSDSANDCLSIATACATINQTVNAILYPHVDNLQSSPIVFLASGSTFSECLTFQGQLVGVNVGFIEGSGGQALWNANGACAALLIADNAEWETSNLKFSGPVAGGTGVYIHQTAVVDMLAGTDFGAFSGGVAIGSDRGGFINFDQNGGTVNIGPGNVGVFLQMGPGTQMVGSFTATGNSVVNVGTFMQISGAGAMANYSTVAVGGSFASLGTSTCRGPSAFTSGGSIPGGAPTATLGCQSM